MYKHLGLLVGMSIAVLWSGGEAIADEVIADDLIVQGRTCIGPPCIDGESFGTGTLRLKDTETRIDFINTNTSPFARRDWRIEANSMASGGAQYLAIKDMGDSSSGAEGGTALFTATAGAPENSIFIDNLGRVGFRTGAPQLNLHVKTGNTPAMRFEQDTSGGQSAQTWDVGGNEAGFFFARDVTAGGTFPFRIRPGAPNSSIDIASTGYVGTATPARALDVWGPSQASIGLGRSTTLGLTLTDFTDNNIYMDVANDLFIRDGTGGAGGTNMVVKSTGLVGIGTSNPARLLDAAGIVRSTATFPIYELLQPDGAGFRTLVDSNDSLLFQSSPDSFATPTTRMNLTNTGLLTVAAGLTVSTGNVGIGTAAPGAQLHTTSTVRFAGVANCASGIKSDASGNLSCITSSRRFKAVAGKLSPDVALANVMALRPQVGTYKETPDEPEHWLIAEDVAVVDPALVGLQDGKPYTVKTQNVVADLVAVIQQQQRLLQEQERRIEALELKAVAHPAR
jgi:hypothetical protein